MSSNLITAAALFAVLVVGLVIEFLIFAGRERSRRAQQEQESNALLEKARKEAESIVRDAMLAANERALKLRTETEQVVAARHKELDITEHRLITREELLNGQLENCGGRRRQSSRRGRRRSNWWSKGERIWPAWPR
jgi:ribonuclease Y